MAAEGRSRTTYELSAKGILHLTQISAKAKPDWSKRIARAENLKEQRPWAGEVLLFYKRILEFQRGVYDGISKASSESPHTRPLRDSLDFGSAADRFPEVVALVRRHGPAAMAEEAAKFAGLAHGEVEKLLSTSAHNEPLPLTDKLLTLALLQPYAELLAQRSYPANADSGRGLCPACDGKPLVSVLRPEGDGGKRWLLCSFCMTEWEFRRILCPYCGEQDNHKLPLFSGEEGSALSLHACLTCRHYLKTVDMTVDGHAVPLVDEMATAKLDLWAAEQGYQKLQQNLLSF